MNYSVGMQVPTLEEVIRQHVSLNPRANNRGFFSVLCKVCNDHGNKGDRGGFKFDGGTVGYNCFNCGHSAIFDPMKHGSMPKGMAIVLDSFGIPKVDWEGVLYTALVNRNNDERKVRAEEFKSIEPIGLEMPNTFYPLTNDPEDEWAQYAIEYLTERSVDWTKHPFHLVRKTNHPDNKRWYGRLIIPIYKKDKLVFWQGRDLTDTNPPKYRNPNVVRDCILSGYDSIHLRVEEPLYITEGWFDSFHLQGVAVFGNQMTPEQIKWINQSSRQKVVIPDASGDGQLLAMQAHKLGWSVAFPDIGSCKDVNAAVQKYGLLYTLKTIKEHTCTGPMVEMRIGLYCEPGVKTSSKKN